MGIILYLMAFLPAYGVFPCNWNSNTLNTEDPPNSGITNVYHCLSLNATGTITVQGSRPLIIYVEGNTQISAIINLDGTDGTNGDIGFFSGGDGGPGGFEGGGVTNFFNTDGDNGEDGGHGGGGSGGSFGTAPFS